ncbi:MAG: FtsX-like permease family protein [Saccharospirillum sp.]
MSHAALPLFWALRTLLSHHRRHPLQTLFLLIGLITGVGLWSAVQVINAHARSSYAEADQVLGAQTSDWIRPTGTGIVAPEAYAQLRRAGFRQLFPVLERRLTSADNEPVWLIATDLLSLPLADAGTPSTATGAWLSLVTPPYQTWVPESLALRLGLNEGDRLSLADGRRLPPTVLQTQAQQGQRLFMDIGVAMTLLEAPGFSYLAASNLTPDERERLRQALPDSLQLVRNQQRLDLTELTQSLHSHLNAMSLLSFAVGLFIVFNAVRFSLNQRRKVLVTLREMGVGTGTLSLAIGIETLLWSLVGAAAGLGLGYLLGVMLLPSVASTLQNLYGAVVDSALMVQPGSAVLAWLMTLGGLLLALAWPLWQQARQPILASQASAGHWQADAIARRRLLWLACGLMVLAILMYANLNHIWQGFVVLALVLFGAAFALPGLLALALKGLLSLVPESAWRWRWALTDGLAQLPTLRTAMMALLLALTANLGVETLVGSFRQALETWLGQRLSADLYIQNDRLDLRHLTAEPTPEWMVASHQRNGVMVRWENRPTQIRGLDTGAPDAQSLPLASASGLQRWYDGEPGVLIANEQVQHLAGVTLNDTITLPTPNGDTQWQVVGFYHDYGNPYFQFYLPFQSVERHWPQASPQGLALWLSNTPGSLALAEQALLDAGAEPGDWLAQGRIVEVSLRIFDRTFAITAAMNTLTLVVAGIALLASLFAIHDQRLPSYAHWRSLGLHYREWLLIVATPLLIATGLTWLAAQPLGFALAWILIQDLNVLSFGWTMPLRWRLEPALYLAGLTALVVSATLLISLIRMHWQLPQALRNLGGNDG